MYEILVGYRAVTHSLEGLLISRKEEYRGETPFASGEREEREEKGERREERKEI